MFHVKHSNRRENMTADFTEQELSDMRLALLTERSLWLDRAVNADDPTERETCLRIHSNYVALYHKVVTIHKTAQTV